MITGRENFSPLQVVLQVLALVVAVFCAMALTTHRTPVDQALPLIAALLVVVAAVSHQAVALAVPMLLVGEIAIAGEKLRLGWFGLVAGTAIVAAVLIAHHRAPGEFRPQAVATVAAIALLRGIPFAGVSGFRELVLLLFALAILWALRSTPLGVAVATLTAFFTPAAPWRTLLFPLSLLVAVTIFRLAGMRPSSAQVLPASMLALPLLLFSWSGAVARGLPVLVRSDAHWPRMEVGVSLAGGETKLLEVPNGATSLILSGAHVSHLPNGFVVGLLEPGGRLLRIGDLADWGALRRGHAESTRNPLPKSPAGRLREYGYSAWMDGAARIALPPGARHVRVTADSRLRGAARLQIESFELGSR